MNDLIECWVYFIAVCWAPMMLGFIISDYMFFNYVSVRSVLFNIKTWLRKWYDKF